MFDSIMVLPRVTDRHPEISKADIKAAVSNALAIRRRNYDSPCHYTIAGADTKGRLIEIVGAEQVDGTLIVYHAMKLTNKMANELDL